jgi:hypothetical protein
MKRFALIIQMSIMFSIIAIGQNETNNSLLYLNQTPPGLKPEVFAPGLISTSDEYEFGSVFSKNADKLVYAERLDENWKAEIRYTEIKNGKWTAPKRLDLDTAYGYNDPYVSEDGKILFYVSNRTMNGKGKSKDFDIWYQEMNDEKWSEPINIGNVINSEYNEFYVSITNNKTIYFASNSNHSPDNEWDYDIYYSKMQDVDYQPPVNLGTSINTKYFECDAFVSPDESYIIFCSSRPGGFGQGDLYISFKDENGEWTIAKNMGELINTETHEFCPFVTMDGRYFSYTSRSDIYWVDARIIEEFRD